MYTHVQFMYHKLIFQISDFSDLIPIIRSVSFDAPADPDQITTVTRSLQSDYLSAFQLSQKRE